MSDEIKANVPDAAAEKPAETAPKPKRKNKGIIVLAVIAGVLAIAVVGGLVWHNQPSFCNAICHTPMDKYYETYAQEPGVAGFDKYGNEVSDTSAMLAVTHAAAGVTCLDCHEATTEQQIEEAKAWYSGNYRFPLKERRLKDLVVASGKTEDEFCLREGCHGVTRDDLVELTSEATVNPHLAIHGQQSCSNCHKAHRASTILCTQCHTAGVIMPDGWLTVAEASKLVGVN